MTLIGMKDQFVQYVGNACHIYMKGVMVIQFFVRINVGIAMKGKI